MTAAGQRPSRSAVSAYSHLIYAELKARSRELYSALDMFHNALAPY